MPAPVEVIQEFLALPEEEKIVCSKTSSLGPYFEYDGYILTLQEVSEADSEE